MKQLEGKVAVVTGAASGIGKGLAKRCLREGMSVVLADVEEAALTQAEQEMSSSGNILLSVVTDVSKESDVRRLAQQTLDAFEAIHLLFNNAGVGAGQRCWDTTILDWQWTLGVNLWGVIHGVRVFVPIMLQQETECHIVNTASIAGFISYHPTCASYHVSKHAVVALSEQLHYDLREEEARIGVSVLCPGGVRTRIGESRRNRPESLTDDTAPTKPRPENESIRNLRQVVAEGMLPDDVGEKVFAAIRENRFYILTHPEYKTMIRTRMEDILAERNPTNPTFFVA